MAEQKRTQFAMQALGFADVFNMKVGDQRVSGHRVELSAPDGPSTGGGKQSVQHVKLVPEAPGGPVVVAGTADPVEKKAELRSWDYLQQLHAQRFKGKTVPVDRVQYAALVKRMQAFFADQGLAVVMLEAAPMASSGASPGAARTSSGAAIVIFVLVAAAIAGALFYFLRKG